MKKNTFIFILFCSIQYFASAQSMDDKIKSLANEIADQVAKSGKKTVAVAIPTYKKSQTEFGEYIAEKLSGKLAISNRGISVVNQKMLAELLKQNKLTTEGLLVAKNDAAKLGQASGIEALVYGVITSFGEELQLTINIVELKTTNVFGNAEVSFSLTNAIKNMLNVIEEQVPINPLGEEGVEQKKGLNGKWLYYANDGGGCQDMVGTIIEFKEDKAIIYSLPDPFVFAAKGDALIVDIVKKDELTFTSDKRFWFQENGNRYPVSVIIKIVNNGKELKIVESSGNLCDRNQKWKRVSN